VIFLGEFSHCGYKCFFEDIGNFCFKSANSRKKRSTDEKNQQNLQITKLQKEKRTLK
jgi:hypothetical protein